MMEKVLEGGEAFVPGRYYVEFLPFLRHIPGWVPGAGFQKDFAEWRHAAEWVRNVMAERTKEGMVRTVLPVSHLLAQGLRSLHDNRSTVGRLNLSWRNW